MLQTIRDRAQGWLAFAIVILISVPFALWGVYNYMEPGGSATIAKVNKQELDLRSYQRAQQQYRQQIQAMLGDQFDINQLNQERLRQEALRFMIEQELLRQAALGSGLRISDEQVAAAIHSLEAFNQGGLFRQDLYEQRLRVLGMNPVSFEEQLRVDMVTEQLRQGLADSAFITPKEVLRLARLENQRRDIGYAVVSARPFRDAIEVSEEDIAAYYEANPQRFIIPEQVRLAYIELSVAGLAETVSVSDEQLEAYYRSHRSSFGLEEQRNPSHLLVAVAADAPEADRDQARVLAEEFRRRAAEGESFEAIAAAHGPGTEPPVEAGELGFLEKGVMEPVFDEALFALEEGELSEVLETEFGFQIIRLDGVRQATVKSFDEVREEVAEAYRREQAERIFFEQGDLLATLSFEHPDTLEPASEAIDVPIQETALFSRQGGPGIAMDPRVVEAAFSPEVLEEGLNSDPIELGDNRMLVLRVKEHHPAERQALDEVREVIREEIIFERARELAHERGRMLLERLRSGESAETLMAAEELEWTVVEDVGRQDPNVTRAIVRAAFRLGRPEDDRPLFGGVPMGTGDYGVVAVYAVRDPGPEMIDDSHRQRLAGVLEEIQAGEAWRDFIALQRERADIRILRENLSSDL